MIKTTFIENNLFSKRIYFLTIDAVSDKKAYIQKNRLHLIDSSVKVYQSCLGFILKWFNKSIEVLPHVFVEKRSFYNAIKFQISNESINDSEIEKEANKWKKSKLDIVNLIITVSEGIKQTKKVLEPKQSTPIPSIELKPIVQDEPKSKEIDFDWIIFKDFISKLENFEPFYDSTFNSFCEYLKPRLEYFKGNQERINSFYRCFTKPLYFAYTHELSFLYNLGKPTDQDSVNGFELLFEAKIFDDKVDELLKNNDEINSTFDQIVNFIKITKENWSKRNFALNYDNILVKNLIKLPFTYFEEIANNPAKVTQKKELIKIIKLTRPVNKPEIKDKYIDLLMLFKLNVRLFQLLDENPIIPEKAKVYMEFFIQNKEYNKFDYDLISILNKIYTSCHTKNTDLDDFTFYLGPEKKPLKFNSSLLSLSFKVFEDSFKGQTSLELPNYSYDDWKQTLDFIVKNNYSEVVEPQAQQYNIYYILFKYQFIKLDHLNLKISKENLVDSWLFYKKLPPHLDSIKNHCLHYISTIVNNIKDEVNIENFLTNELKDWAKLSVADKNEIVEFAKKIYEHGRKLNIYFEIQQFNSYAQYKDKCIISPNLKNACIETIGTQYLELTESILDPNNFESLKILIELCKINYVSIKSKKYDNFYYREQFSKGQQLATFLNFFGKNIKINFNFLQYEVDVNTANIFLNLAKEYPNVSFEIYLPRYSVQADSFREEIKKLNLTNRFKVP